MRHLHTSIALFAAAGFISTVALVQAAPSSGQNESNNAQSQHDASNEHQSANENSKNSGNSAKAPDGYVIVDEQLITLTANEPQNHFLRAKEYLAANDPRAAAAEIRIAAGYLDMQASRKNDTDRQELRSQSNELRQLADQIGKSEMQAKNGKSNGASGQSAEQQRLNQAFASAERTLAKNFQEEAKNDLSKQRAVRAGEDLDAAANSLRASFAWSGGQCSKECTQAISEARTVTDELLMPEQAGQKHQNSNNQQTAQQQEKESPNGEAQPASARLSGQGEQNGAQATNRIPQNAEQAVDALGKAIDTVNTNSANGGNNAAGNQQHASTDNNK